jgi:hypothetical protein
MMSLRTACPASRGPAPGPVMVTCPTRACLEHHGAGGAVDARQGIAVTDEPGLHAGRHAARSFWPGDAERRDVLDTAADRPRLGDLPAGDGGDAPHGDLPVAEPPAEDQARQDHHLRRGVVALDVRGRVPSGQAGPLRPGQRILIGPAVCQVADTTAELLKRTLMPQGDMRGSSSVRQAVPLQGRGSALAPGEKASQTPVASADQGSPARGRAAVAESHGYRRTWGRPDCRCGARERELRTDS